MLLYIYLCTPNIFIHWTLDEDFEEAFHDSQPMVDQCSWTKDFNAGVNVKDIWMDAL